MAIVTNLTNDLCCLRLKLGTYKFSDEGKDEYEIWFPAIGENS